MKLIKLIILFFSFPLCVLSQEIKGTITDIFDVPLIGANVYWINSTIGTTTDSLGKFSLQKTNKNQRWLAISYIGFDSDTIEVKEHLDLSVQLIWSQNVEEVLVQAEKKGVIISDLNPIKTEQLTQTELGKAACCDLAGCFETQASVQPQTTNVVTNSKELRMLGLSGVYTQLLIDGFPMIQGLTYTYGISSLPGTMVDNIFISKGANSVLQGFESISGQINVETKEADKTEKLYLNTYINNFGEKHLNANVAFTKNKWSNLTSVHSILPARRIDRDRDQFLDLPLLNRIRVSNKTKYGNEQEAGFYSSLGFRYLDEKRLGGQKSFDPKTDLGSGLVYGQHVEISQPEFWSKTGYRLNNKHNFKLLASTFYQSQNSYFGTVSYDANQTNIYSNLQYELSYSQHNLKTGISYRHLNLDEDIQYTQNRVNNTYDGVYERKEHILGFFAENTLNLFEKKLTWISGLRVDDHNQFGTQITPRMLLKYNIAPQTVIRANIGTGWRTVNLFSENINLLVSSRDVLFKEELKPESAWNSGINITHKFGKDDFSGYLTFDYYRTDFKNQIFPDYDTDPTKAIIENFEGESVSNTFQAEAYFNILECFEFKAGYTFLDVYRMIEGKKELLPFNARHKILGSFSYKPISNRYHVDINTHWYGRQRLPNTMSNPLEFQRPDHSETYAVLNAQYTHNFGKFEIYLGCENIFDFRQLRPILSWEDPFGPYFDTSSVWGPTRGREFYLGARYKIQ